MRQVRAALNAQRKSKVDSQSHARSVADWKDDFNRSFPGYPGVPSPPFAGRVKLTSAQCWNESNAIFVRTIDICPCRRPSEQGGYNRACCMTAPHLDLSYWAFEKLAHPLFGDMTIQFRPVDCETRQPLSASTAANATSGGVLGGATSLVYDGDFVRGWAFNSFKVDWANLTLPAGGMAAGLSGSSNRNATCVQISGAGGLIGFYCARCRDVFSDAVRVRIRPAQQLSGNPTGGGVPPLQVVVSRREYNSTSGGGGEVYCDKKPTLSDAYKTGSGPDGYNTYTIPFADFGCTRLDRASANRITLVNPSSNTNDLLTFCIDRLSV